MTPPIITPTDAALTPVDTRWPNRPPCWKNQAVNHGELATYLLLSRIKHASGLAARLAERYRVVAVDWLGFGAIRLPSGEPHTCSITNCCKILSKIFFSAVAAAGHATGYVMRLVQQECGHRLC